MFFEKKVTFNFSSVPGPKEGYRWGPYQIKSLTGHIPAQGEVTTGILVTALHNNLKIGIISDSNGI